LQGTLAAAFLVMVDYQDQAGMATGPYQAFP
jgi:hypothetical protein